MLGESVIMNRRRLLLCSVLWRGGSKAAICFGSAVVLGHIELLL